MNLSKKLTVKTIITFYLLPVFSILTMACNQPNSKIDTDHLNTTVSNDLLIPATQDHQLFVQVPSSGSIQVTLHPNTTVELHKPVNVSFGVPFPRSTLSDTTLVSISDADNSELPSRIKATSQWRSLNNKINVDSIRSIIVTTQVIFPSHKAVNIQVNYGKKHKRYLEKNINIINTREAISAGPNPTEYATKENIMEPKVYATLPPQWLGACLLRSRTLSMGKTPDLSWFDEAFTRFSETAINQVSKAVKAENLIDYQQQFEPWLYDRAMTLYGIYIRTGKLKWLRHAHRATQFYAKHITDNGFFDKKKGYKNSPPNDLKYSYGQALFINLMLMGDTSHIVKIEAIAKAAQQWKAGYSYQTKRPILWTERHQAFALLAALTAWEATGKQRYALRVNSMVKKTFSQTLNPPAKWKPEGCPMHTYKDHEGFGSSDPVCSSWMNALLAEAVFRYYIHSDDNNALEFLSGLSRYYEGSGTYIWNKGGAMQGLRMPHYLSSNVFKRYPNGNWDDFHHACDVAAASARSAWALKKLGRNSQSINKITLELLQSCRYSFDYMHRQNADTKYGKTVWRLSVPRQYNWWFGSTLDLSWLLYSTSH